MAILPRNATSSLRRMAKPEPFVMWGLLLIFFVVVGAWLVGDLRRSYENVLTDTALLATQRSQVIGQTFRTQVLASDYVLRDVLARIQERDLVFPDLDRDHARRMTKLLKDKAETVPEFFSMVLFNRDCVFTATATGANAGVRSRQELCEERKHHRGPGPLVNYVPGTQSVSGRSVIVLSRNLWSPRGDFQGGVLGVIDLERTQHWFESLGVDTRESVALLDDNKVLLARLPVLAGATEKREPSITVPGSLMPSPSDVGRALQVDVDGRERIFGISRIAGLPFTVVYGFDKAKVIQPWRRRAMELSVGYCIMLLLALLVARSHRTNVHLIRELQSALREVQTLQGFLPICSYCKKIRDDGGAWSQMEMYISSRSKATFSHGVCPDCLNHLRDDLGIGGEPRP